MEEIFGHSMSKKSISSEIVKYEIFILQNDIVSLETLEDVRIKCLAHATSLTKDYVWHNEGFNLAVCDAKHCCKVPDDRTPHSIKPENVNYFDFRIKDADGEFLLIEAAEFLPKWLNVDTSNNRVFIHDGSVHIVTQPTTPGQIAKLPIGQPTLEEALRSIHYYPSLTLANSKVEGCIRNRVAKFPGALSEYVQKVNVYIPEMIARVLDQDASLVSAAIKAFYFRDPIDLKACRVFKEFSPNTRVWSQVSMNRCGYAQLMQQIFNADKRSGYSIPKAAGNDFKGMDVGSKISHGFEILCSGCSTNNDNVFDEHGFQKYIAALQNRDYFCGEIEGSRRYNELMSNARSYFSKMSTESVRNECQSISKSVGQRIFQVKKRIVDNPCSTSSNLLIKQQQSELPMEDGDQWMYLDDGKMDDLLSEMKNGFEKLGKMNVNMEPREETGLDDLSDKMQSFINKLSDYEGVEQLDNESEVKFDPLTFKNALKQLCDISEDEKCFSDEFLSSDDDDSAENESCSDSEIHDAMQQMDAELASTDVGKSFVREQCVGDGNYKPVDIDLNLVQNFLQSCESETDMHGAATTLLQSLGLNKCNEDIS